MKVDIWIPFATALISALVFIVKTVLKNKKRLASYPKHSEARTKRLLGKWRGCLEQDNPKDTSVRLETTLEMTFKQKGKIIKGEGKFHNPDKGLSVDVNLYNGMFDDNILKIDYENKEKYIFQKGATVLEMDSNGSSLNGYFIGYSPGIDKVITGIVKLEKVG